MLGAAGVLHFVTTSTADGPTIESAGPGSNGYFWRPSTATVGVGGSVSFKSASLSVPHGVRWTGGPESPSCSGVPVEQEKTGWSGSCTFAQAGTYSFVCTVHPTEMKGTITVSSTEVPAGPPPPPGRSSESPLNGAASRALRLAKSQHGSSVRGSIELSPASAGGRLEVLLLAKRGSRVGRFSRSSLEAGRLSFAVPLKPRARRSLRASKRLPLTVEVVVTPPGRAALTLKRGVVLHV
ncbi:MAG TPA: plastocyanin/azurin family copper-binding protein [Solirubrobacterales bacterium]